MERKPMPVSTPEREGIPSAAIERYLRGINDEQLAMHSVVVVRHGKIAYETYWKPMDADFRHRLYSCSKSFVSVAVGYLASQGLLSLDDHVVKYFPEKVAGRTIDPYLAEATVRDLLRMSSCYTKGSNYSAAAPDWVETFFDDEVSHVPGAVYSYCTSGTTILCYIVRRVTGKNFLDVLRPVFDEIGISEDIFCVQTPDGTEWGGSGVCATSREFAKFANLVMHYGEYEGKQLLPRDYLMEATSRQIDNSLDAGTMEQGQGYGYQFWMMKNDGFAFFGMGGQYALCFPKKDMVIVTTGYEELMVTARLHALFGGLWREIFPYLSDEPLPDDPDALKRLNDYASQMELAFVKGESASPMQEQVAGKTYYMRENVMGLKTMRFDFAPGEGKLTYENATGIHVLRFGLCGNIKQELPERYPIRRFGTKSERGYDCYVSGAWTMPDTLMIHIHIADVHLGQVRWAVGFKGNTVTVRGVKHAEWFMDQYEGFASGAILE